MTILPFTIDRYRDVVALWEQCDGVRLTEADTAENISRFLVRNPGMSFVAIDGGAVVGALLCGHDGRRGYLHHLAVAVSHRKRSIGRSLVDAAIDALLAEGIAKCHLFVVADNDSGIAFWRHINWELRSDIHIMSRVLALSPHP